MVIFTGESDIDVSKNTALYNGLKLDGLLMAGMSRTPAVLIGIWISESWKVRRRQGLTHSPIQMRSTASKALGLSSSSV